MLDASNSRFPKRTALVFGTKKVTYKELSSTTKRLAAGLSGLGVSCGDKAAIWLPNSPEFVYSFFAVTRLGAAAVPINTMLKREEAHFILEDSRAKVLIVSIDKYEDAQNLLSRIDSLTSLICVPAPAGSNALDFYALIRDNQELFSGNRLSGGEAAQIVYTSGTTGKPKGAILTHENILSNVRAASTVFGVHSRDVFLCILPLFHSFASTVCLFLPLYNGAAVVLMRAVRPFKRVVRAVFKNRVSIFVAVPALYNILAGTKTPFLKLFLNILVNPVRLYVSGASALSAKVWKKFEQRFRRPLLEGYGLTEASPVVSVNPQNKRKPDSVGLALPGVEIKITDKVGKTLSAGEVGEIAVRGPNVMAGYYNHPQETAAVIRAGWLYTGDLGKFDSDGYLYIVGRLKEMINVRGLNVYPREIEDLLYEHSGIKEAAVIGLEHRHRGEVPVAVVVAEGKIDEHELMMYLRRNLASYKVPLKVISRESLPKNATGKVLKRELVEAYKDLFQKEAVA